MGEQGRPDLSQVDEVQIVDLTGIYTGRVDEYMSASESARYVSLVDRSASEVLELWRQLPHAGQMRCHNPPLGLRFLRAGVIVARASVCWECNNVFGDAEGEDFFFEFDGKSPPARELLARAKAALGPDDRGRQDVTE